MADLSSSAMLALLCVNCIDTSEQQQQYMRQLAGELLDAHRTLAAST
jgi:hypothetical protein